MSNKQKKLFSFFEKKTSINLGSENQHKSSQASKDAEDATKIATFEDCSRVGTSKQIPNPSASNSTSFSFIRDPGQREPIWKVPVNERDQVKRAYLEAGPYQFKLDKYPLDDHDQRRFQYTWFADHSSWLEYSPTKDAAYCLPCYLFTEKSRAQYGWDVFTDKDKGFRKWKKVRNGKRCSLLKHIGSEPSSPHNKAILHCAALLNQSTHIDKVIEKQSELDVARNRLRVRTSIDVVRFLAFQGISFRGHDESANSKNRGNFIELIKFLASYNNEVESVVLHNAPGNAIYVSSDIQKEILQVFAHKVRKKICDEIGDSRFCIIVDESCDESKKEQMALVLRFVDINGLIQERFFQISHVKDTKSGTLYTEINIILERYGLNIRNLRGQGYDGASNMRGEWNGLQAMFLNECPHAYYIHCLAHRLQLALVSASREVLPVHQFFLDITLIVNAVTSSAKHHDELQDAHIEKIALLIENDEIETGTGVNQIGTLRRPCDTRWSSHFGSIHSLLNMFDATCEVLGNIEEDGSGFRTRGGAGNALEKMTSFKFVFVAHMMYDIFGITEHLCMILQEKRQDIVKAMDTVRITSILLQRLRTNGWDSFLHKVELFCLRHEVHIPDLSSPHYLGRGKRRRDDISLEHYYHYDVFNAGIDFQLQELSSRFNDRILDLLRLSSSLNPKDGFASFDIPSICMLASKYYPQDFTCQELGLLKYQLEHFYCDVTSSTCFEELLTIGALCQVLTSTQKKDVYFLVDRLIRLILTLPVSTATTERANSAMKIVKTRLRNKIGQDFLADSLLLYIEKDIAETFNIEELIDDFKDLKERRVRF